MWWQVQKEMVVLVRCEQRNKSSTQFIGVLHGSRHCVTSNTTGFPQWPQLYTWLSHWKKSNIVSWIICIVSDKRAKQPYAFTLYIYIYIAHHCDSRTEACDRTMVLSWQLPKVSLSRWPVCRSTLPMPSWLSSADFEAGSGRAHWYQRCPSTLPVLSARDRRFWATFDCLCLSDGQSLFEHWSHLRRKSGRLEPLLWGIDQNIGDIPAIRRMICDTLFTFKLRLPVAWKWGFPLMLLSSFVPYLIWFIICPSFVTNQNSPFLWIHFWDRASSLWGCQGDFHHCPDGHSGFEGSWVSRSLWRSRLVPDFGHLFHVAWLMSLVGWRFPENQQ